MLILNEATASFDGPSQAHVLTSLLGEFEGRTLIWALHRASLAKYFDKIIVLKSGRVAQTGTFTELEGKEGPLSQLLSAE